MPSHRPTIYLASRSPRRMEILYQHHIPFKVIPSTYHERNRSTLHPEILTLQHAYGKLKKAQAQKSARLILSADTLVYFNKHILGKPKSLKEAYQMIQMLSGRVHHVYTGIALFDRRTSQLYTGYALSKVYFKKLSHPDIEDYFSKVNPMDKAGSYAIQEGPKIVRKIRGSLTNIIGLPIELLQLILKEIH